MRRRNRLRKFTTFLLTVTFVLNFILPGGAAFAYTETSRTSWQEPVGEGVTVDNIKIQTTEGPVPVYVMTVDLTNPYVKVDTLAGSGGMLTNTKGVSTMAKETGAIGAINGDFFQMGEKAPIGLTVQSGQLISSPAQRTDMYGFGLTNDNRPVFTLFSFQGDVTAPTGVQFKLSGMNKPTYLADKGVKSDLNTLHMYTPKWGAKSRGPVTGLNGMVEMVVDNDIVQEIRVNQPAVAIPQNGYILAGNGVAGEFLTKNFVPGDFVQVNYSVSPENDNLMAAVGGQALLVESGKRHWFSQNITGKRARTAIGASQDGSKLYLVVVEGGNGSRGMTQEELADFMISIGAWTAVNLDGGGSSTMVARHLGDNSVSVLNTPQATSERALPTGIGIYTTAPSGALMGMKLSGPKMVLAGTKNAYTVKGYDEHYNPYFLGSSDVYWEVSSDVGYFEGNVFKAVYSGDAVITASYNNISQQYPVKILGSSDIAKLEVTPSVISINPGEILNVTVKVTTKQGQVFNLQPGEYDVQVSGDIGMFAGGKFQAGNQVAVGELIVKVDSTVSNVKVNVGGVEKPLYGFETPQNLKFKGYPMGLTLGGFRLTNSSEPSFRGKGAGRLEYDFSKSTTGTRAGYGNFESGIALPGQPVGLGLWVYGNNSGHWLRARVFDASGTEKLVDFAQHLDWNGWKHVKALLPAGLKYPVKLTDLYLVETDSKVKDKGTIYFDELTVFGTPEPGDQHENVTVEQEVAPGKLVNLKIDQSLEIRFNNPAKSPEYNIKAQQVWNLELPSPGYNPIMPVYNLAGMANGDDVDQISGNMRVQFKIKNAANINRLRLMLWDSKAGVWKHVPAALDAGKLTITGKTNRLGIFALMDDVRPAPVFSDTASHWAKSTITKMAQLNIVKGFPNGEFLPGSGVTRAEFVTLIGNTLGWAAETTDVKFKDEIPLWAKGSIAAAVNKGIIKGYDDGTFRPNKVVTRAEMAVIIDKALNLPQSSRPSAYSDAKAIPDWAVQSIRNTKVTGLMLGSNNRFRPRDVANRAEATAVMGNILSYYLAAEN